MSYSFNVRAASVATALASVATEFDKVVASQPVHDLDRTQAEKVANEFVPLIGEPGEGQELSVSVNGYVQTTEGTLTAVSVGVSAHIVTKTEG